MVFAVVLLVSLCSFLSVKIKEGLAYSFVLATVCSISTNP